MKLNYIIFSTSYIASKVLLISKLPISLYFIADSLDFLLLLEVTIARKLKMLAKSRSLASGLISQHLQSYNYIKKHFSTKH